MKDWIIELCGGGFMPHGQCYLWTPSLIWLHAVSDGLIALAYFSIPGVLFYFLRRRRDVPYPRVVLMCALFIVSCGITHLLEVWTIWHSAYYLSGAAKAFTAVVSLITAIALIRLIPEALKFAGPAELKRLNESLEERVRLRTADLEAANERLQREVAERERADAEITRLNQLLQRRVDELQILFDILPVGLGIAEDRECRSIRTNRELARILELAPAANASLTAPEHEAPAHFEVWHRGRRLAPEELPMQVCARENREIRDFEETVRHRDGRAFDLLSNAIPLRNAQGEVTGCIGTFQDITAHRAGRAARARLAAIINSSEDAIIGRDRDGLVTDWNAGAQKVFGHGADEMIGRSLDRLIPAELAAQEHEALASIARGEHVPPFETTRRRKDGSLVQVSIMISPIRDESGAVVGFSKLARDISERIEAERQRGEIERKIQETQKLESLGVLAGGIAHDFNNLLTAILGNVSLAAMSKRSATEMRPYLHQIETASRRAAELCNQMLAYSGRGRFVLARLDLNEIISDTTHLISISIGKTCVLRLNPAPVLPAVLADPTQLRQIIMNLVINASDAIGERSGVIALTTGAARIDEAYRATLNHGSELALGDYVFMEVSDNGCGMDALTLARIFDPFFTTKFTGRGLGLAAVLGIIRGHRGALKVYSEPGRGTTFKIFLPAADGSAEALTDRPAVADAHERAQGVVLIADDEETVRSVAGRMLEELGYTVDLAADGREAVELFRAAPARYRLVLLDLTMPHLDGEETFRQLRHLRPGVRVVLMSGFNEHDAVGRFIGKGLAGFVQKPFTVEMLAKAVRAVFLAE